MSIVGEKSATKVPPLHEYNYSHFKTKHVLADIARSFKGEGIRPGQEALDFELESTDLERHRLSDFRGRPVVLHFTSVT